MLPFTQSAKGSQKKIGEIKARLAFRRSVNYCRSGIMPSEPKCLSHVLLGEEAFDSSAYPLCDVIQGDVSPFFEDAVHQFGLKALNHTGTREPFPDTHYLPYVNQLVVTPDYPASSFEPSNMGGIVECGQAEYD